MSQSFYQFHPYETGVFVEIFLPKRAEFQGTLYKTLTEGFDLEKVKAHFRDEDKRPRIRKLLEKYYDVIAHYTDETIDGLEQLFFGYSMYEVDGVFYSKKKGIVEERTQIIRMIYMPDFEYIYSSFIFDPDPVRNEELIVDLVKLFLRLPESTTEKFEKYNKLNNEKEKRLMDYLSKWVDDMGLFLFGYIVFELCERVVELHVADMTGRHQIEDEIWVTSMWHFALNRIVFE